MSGRMEDRGHLFSFFHSSKRCPIAICCTANRSAFHFPTSRDEVTPAQTPASVISMKASQLFREAALPLFRNHILVSWYPAHSQNVVMPKSVPFFRLTWTEA